MTGVKVCLLRLVMRGRYRASPSVRRDARCCDRPHEDLFEIDLASYPFTWVNGSRVVCAVDDGPPMSEDQWVEKYCTPD